ncbi:uncharacterized protein [Pseudorasbora parva]|uniref:uncharacterized protein isoform X1 n=1 Tax=Pseudorasbora parva TaxID=51549 RepID=UPI00351EEE8A
MMKLLFRVLLMVVILALQKCQELNMDYEGSMDYSGMWALDDVINVPVPNITVPNITVYRQMEDRERDSVIVLCMFDQMAAMRYSWWMQSVDLSVESELNYTKEIVQCSSLESRPCVFMVTVSPPASFTCVHEIHTDEGVKNVSSQTYHYKQSVLYHHEEGVSLFYICYSSSIAVGLFIMTVAVIVTSIRSKDKAPSCSILAAKDALQEAQIQVLVL